MTTKKRALMNRGVKRKAPRVLAIGFDAGEPSLVENWISGGFLPNLARLMNKGTYLRLQSVADIFCDSVWPCFYTGTNPASHGHYSLRQVIPGTVKQVPSVNRSYKRPFWHHFKNRDKRVVVFDVPKVLPQDQGADIHIVGWGEHYPFVQDSRPPEVLKEIHGKFGKHPHMEEVFSPKSISHERKLLQRMALGAKVRADIGLYLMEKIDWDLFLTVFSESHSAGHQFFHHRDPDSPFHDKRRAGALANAMREGYMHVDRQIGRLMDAAGEHTDIMVFSVHGLRTEYTTCALLAPLLVALGFQVPPAKYKADPAAALRRLIPVTIREKINRLLPISIQNKILTHLFEHGCDWRKTTAFAEDPREGSPFIRINLKGREPVGIVNPGKQYDALCERITRKLLQVKVHPGGQRAVRKVCRTDRIFSGKYLRDLPDLIVHWERKIPITALELPDGQIVTSDLSMIQKTQHGPDAFLIAAGPRFKTHVRRDRATILDLAPTLMYLTDSPIPSDMEGRVIVELLKDEFLAKHSLKFGEASEDVAAWNESAAGSWQ